MKLFHTSPKEITKIDRFGNFEDCLFFSSRVYQMAIGEVITYSIDAENMDFVEAWKLSDDEISAEIAKKIASRNFEDEDLELAEELLDTSKNLWEVGFDIGLDSEDIAEIDWFIQAKRGQCAKKMGFDGCLDEDEQGAVYIIPMLGRESILVEE